MKYVASWNNLALATLGSCYNGASLGRYSALTETNNSSPLTVCCFHFIQSHCFQVLIEFCTLEASCFKIVWLPDCSIRQLCTKDVILGMVPVERQATNLRFDHIYASKECAKLSRIKSYMQSNRNVINIWQMFNVGTDEITAKPYIQNKKFISMNLLQMSCVITYRVPHLDLI